MRLCNVLVGAEGDTKYNLSNVKKIADSPLLCLSVEQKGSLVGVGAQVGHLKINTILTLG